MKPSVKHYADYLSMGLEIEVCFQSDVVAWADRLIDQSDRPEMWMINLSTSGSKNILDVQHLLHDVPGTSNLEISFKLLIAQLSQHHPIIQPEQIDLLRNLWRFTHIEISEDQKIYIYRIDSDLDWFEYSQNDWSNIEQDYNELLSIGEEYKHLIEVEARSH